MTPDLMIVVSVMLYTLIIMYARHRVKEKHRKKELNDAARKKIIDGIDDDIMLKCEGCGTWINEKTIWKSDRNRIAHGGNLHKGRIIGGCAPINPNKRKRRGDIKDSQHTEG